MKPKGSEDMTNLELLIQAANNLCDSLDEISQNEKKFCTNICIAFEQYSWDMHRMANDLQHIKDDCGV